MARSRCKSMYYLAGSTVPDRIVQCWKRAGHKAGIHRSPAYHWYTDQEWSLPDAYKR